MDKPREDPRTVKIRELLMDVYDLRPSLSHRLMGEIDAIAKRLSETDKLIDLQDVKLPESVKIDATSDHGKSFGNIR